MVNKNLKITLVSKEPLLKILIYADYSESYKNKQQREIQSAYFDHTRFNIFTACFYLCDTENKIICESVATSIFLSDHSRVAAVTSVLMVIDHLREKHQYLVLKINFILWSDGCSTQFRSQFIFKLLSSLDSSLHITWCYNERHHGKRPIVSIEGTSKNCAYCDIMSGKCIIDISKSFAEHADKGLEGITSLYLPTEDVLIDTNGINAFIIIKDTLQIHMIKWFYDEQNVPYLQFFKMATKEKPFSPQLYVEGS